MVDQLITSLRQLMKQRGIDAYLVPTSDFHQSEYVGEYFKCRQFLTGFTGSAGTLVVTQQMAGLWTDGRYVVQAEKELKDSCITLYAMGTPQVPTVEEYLAKQLPQNGCLGYDGRVVNHQMGTDLYMALKHKQIRFHYQEDLVDLLWTQRPPLSKEPIWLLQHHFAGKTTREKIESLRQKMKEHGCSVHILTTLDEIAWLLNMRGGDIPCNPMFLSYALIGINYFELFVHREALSDEGKAYLEEHHITLCDYEDIYDRVEQLENETIWLESQKVNDAICRRLAASNIIQDKQNPCVVEKAIKNQVEIDNTKKAHIKDGVAVTRLMYWLKHHIGRIPMTEMSVARYMEEQRQAQEGYLGPSFQTISAYHTNAAMCHYHATEDQHQTLEPRGLLLLDSGGHYYEGTTDITRTFVLGPLTDRERELFTLVVCCMLKAGDMKFLYGCRGSNLDYTIREALWARGLDFNHGTGHGVGYLSSVHERPNGIRWKTVPEREDSAIIEPGMICSDEPGIYLEGELGIRMENLILCVPDEVNQFGRFLRFSFLTMAPIDLDGLDTTLMDAKDLKRLNDYHSQVYKNISPYLTEPERDWLCAATREMK